MIITETAGWKAVGRQARLAGNGSVLAKRRNTADGRFPARPKGAIQLIQYCVTALEKDRAIPCGLRLVLNHLGCSVSATIILKEYY